MHAFKKITFSLLALCVGLSGIMVLFSLLSSGAGVFAQAGYGSYQPLQATETITPTLTPTPVTSLYMPLMRVFKTPEVTLQRAWTSDVLDGKLQAFERGEPMLYQSNGLNNLGSPADIGLNWQQSGPCSSGQIFSNTLTILPGEWSHYIPGVSPNCTGVFTATANMTYTDTNTSLAPRFVVNEPGTVRINLQQGFDKCYHPDIEDMQVWWEESPYVVFNLYMGGVSYACKNNPLDAVYVRQLAEQGWWFIPTWVGPQAPCSSYTHRMSSDRETAYLQGRQEAFEAYQTAEELGLFGDKVIYYDMETYPDITNCRNTVKAFIRGWTEQLQEMGARAGGYGASCRSYITDWAANDPPPDDIWIAHWYLDSYDEDASVWDAICLDPSDDPPIYWLHNQRIRQYAGGHYETWGGVRLNIDSNVLEGKVIYLPIEEMELAPARNDVQVEVIGPVLRDIEFVDGIHGWLLVDESRLLWTEDGGESWQEISPAVFSEASNPGRVLDVRFLNAQDGWVVGVQAEEPALLIARTMDGGRTWATSRMPLDLLDVVGTEAAYLDILDGAHIYLAIKMQSGSSFSRGRLFATQDSGMSWQERVLPLGEPVVFLDYQRGWTAGGAAGDLLYRTVDGGNTWQSQGLGLAERVTAQVGLPRFRSDGQGWLPVVRSGGGEHEVAIYATVDGGATWQEKEQFTYRQNMAQVLITDLTPGILRSEPAALEKLPEGSLSVEFASDQSVWAISQTGSCQGEKYGAPSQPFTCVRDWQLLHSTDSGRTWEEISLPVDSGG